MPKWNLSIRGGIIRRRSFNAIFPAHPTSSPHIHLPCEMKSFKANTNSSEEKINLQGFMWGCGSKSFVRENVFMEALMMLKSFDFVVKVYTPRRKMLRVAMNFFGITRIVGCNWWFRNRPEMTSGNECRVWWHKNHERLPLASSPTFSSSFLWHDTALFMMLEKETFWPSTANSRLKYHSCGFVTPN